MVLVEVASAPSLLDHGAYRNKQNSVPRAHQDQRWHPFWDGAPDGWNVPGNEGFDPSMPSRRSFYSNKTMASTCSRLPPAAGAQSRSSETTVSQLSSSTSKRKWHTGKSDAYVPGRVASVPTPSPDPPLSLPTLGRAEDIHTLALRRLLPNSSKGARGNAKEEDGPQVIDAGEGRMHRHNPWTGQAPAFISAASSGNRRHDGPATIQAPAMATLPNVLQKANKKAATSTWPRAAERGVTHSGSSGRITLLPIARNAPRLLQGKDDLVTGKPMKSQSSWLPASATTHAEPFAGGTLDQEMADNDFGTAAAMSMIEESLADASVSSSVGGGLPQEASTNSSWARESWQEEWTAPGESSPRVAGTPLRVIGRSHTARVLSSREDSLHVERATSGEFFPLSSVKPGVWDQMLKDAAQWLQGVPAHAVPDAVEQMRDWVQDQRWDWPEWWKHCSALLPEEWWDKLPERSPVEDAASSPRAPRRASPGSPKIPFLKRSGRAPALRHAATVQGLAVDTRGQKPGSAGVTALDDGSEPQQELHEQVPLETPMVLQEKDGGEEAQVAQTQEGLLHPSVNIALAEASSEGQLYITPSGHVSDGGRMAVSPHSTVLTLANGRTVLATGIAPASSRSANQPVPMDYETLMAMAFQQQPAHVPVQPELAEGVHDSGSLSMQTSTEERIEQLPDGIAGHSLFQGWQVAPMPWKQGHSQKSVVEEGDRDRVVAAGSHRQDSTVSSNSQQRRSSASGSVGTQASTEFNTVPVSPQLLQQLQSHDPIVRGVAMLQNPALAPDEVTRHMMQEASVRFFNMRKATTEQKMAFVQDLVVRLELKKVRMQRRGSKSETEEGHADDSEASAAILASLMTNAHGSQAGQGGHTAGRVAERSERAAKANAASSSGSADALAAVSSFHAGAHAVGARQSVSGPLTRENSSGPALVAVSSGVAVAAAHASGGSSSISTPPTRSSMVAGRASTACASPAPVMSDRLLTSREGRSLSPASPMSPKQRFQDAVAQCFFKAATRELHQAHVERDRQASLEASRHVSGPSSGRSTRPPSGGRSPAVARAPKKANVGGLLRLAAAAALAARNREAAEAATAAPMEHEDAQDADEAASS